MNNADDEKEIKQETVEVPTQQSASDTSNQDNKVSTDPSGQKYIRADEEV